MGRRSTLAGMSEALGERDPRHPLGQSLGDHRGLADRTHRAAEDGRRHRDALVRRRVDPQRTRHGVVVDQGRVEVDVRLDGRVLFHERRAEHQACHVDGVLRSPGRRYAAHERLRRVAQVRVNHVEMALVHRDVDRLADGSARMMQPRGQVRELDEVPTLLVGIVRQGCCTCRYCSPGTSPSASSCRYDWA